jgi:hypothetical protein
LSRDRISRGRIGGANGIERRSTGLHTNGGAVNVCAELFHHHKS